MKTTKTTNKFALTATSFLLILSMFLTVSCDEEDILDLDDEYCASCVEANSGYAPSDFCSTEASVDIYIRELRNTSGQSWSCTKY